MQGTNFKSFSSASSQKNRGRKSIYDSDGRTIRTKISVDPSTYRFQSAKSRTPCDQLSSITDAQRSRLLSLHNSQLEQKKSRRRTLTKKSLKEFEKTPQGTVRSLVKHFLILLVNETRSSKFPKCHCQFSACGHFIVDFTFLNFSQHPFTNWYI